MKIVRISDGLGNQMFQYAFARKLRLISKEPVYLDNRFINNEDKFAVGEFQNLKGKLGYRKYGLDCFKITLSVTDEQILWKWNYLKRDNVWNKLIYSLARVDFWIWRFWEEDTNVLKKRFDIQKLRGHVYYQGYFFDLKYFDEIKPILQKEFCLKEPIVLPRKLKDVLSYENTVSIHVRRGDFLKLNRNISQSDYYSKAIKRMEERIEKPTYIIFSDDIGWVKENLDIPGEKIFVSEMGFEDYQELIIMKHCKHNIIANSTFSYWAAYLNKNEQKIVICPKGWKTKIIPDEWIKI